MMNLRIARVPWVSGFRFQVSGAALALAAVSLLSAFRSFAADDVPFAADKLCERLQIDPGEGALCYGESDIEMNATGFALALRRSYRSSNAAEGVFGRGWTCLLDPRIETSEKGRAILYDETGRRVAFLRRGRSLLLSEIGRPQWLLLEDNGALLRDWRGQFRSFDQNGRLTGIFNSAMTGVEMEWEEGRIARIYDPYERSIRFKADERGRIVEAQSSAGHVFRYEYAQGRLVRVSDGDGVRAEYSYNSQGRLAAIVLAGSERAEIAYDSQGHVVRLAGPSVAGRTVRYQQRKVPFPARMIEIADALGHVTRYRLRDEPRQWQITLPSGAPATIDYDKRQLPTRIDLPQDRRIELRYDDWGNLKRLTLPGGAEYSFAYTGRGDLKQWTRTDGTTFFIERSEFGQIRQVRSPRSDFLRRLSFDPQGRLAWLADGEGRAILFSHNTRGDLSSLAVQSDMASLLFDHDESGLLSRIAPPGRPALSVIYGMNGLPETLTDSVGYRLALARDRLGRLVGIEDCEGQREHFERDLWGLPNLWRRPKGGESRLTLDREGNPTEIQLPEGNTYRLVHDERNLATSETWLASPRRLQYDEFGCVVARRNGRGQTVRLSYDLMGNPLEIIREGQDTTRFQYGLDGRLLRMTGGDVEYRFGSDAMRRPTRVADTRNKVWAEYSYDPKGRVAALATRGGRWLYEYDAQGRLVRMVLEGEKFTEVRYAYEHDQARLPHRAFLPGGTNIAYEHDPYGRIASLRVTLGSGKTALAERYTYDGRGNLARVESTERRVDLEYDSENRLAAQQLNGHIYARLQYGRDGRLLELEGEEGDLELAYDANGKPVRSSQARLEYDSDGNRISQTTAEGTTNYRFDAVGRLASVTLPSGVAITHTYSPNGWAIGRSRRGQRVGFFFFGDWPLFGTRRNDNTSGWFIADPVWAGPLGIREKPKTDLAYRDALGRLRSFGEAGSDALKTVAWGLFGRRLGPDRPAFFDPLSLGALGFDGEENLSGIQEPATGLLLSPRPLREGLSPYFAPANGRSDIPPAPSRKVSGETVLLEEIAIACAAGRFAPEEGAILRYLFASVGSPGWPNVGSDETFDRVLDGGSFCTPAVIARRIIETALRDGAGGLPASAFVPRPLLPASRLGLGHFRTLCPALSVLPPVILEGDIVGDTVWSDDQAFAGTDNALHGWIGRLIARAADGSERRVAEDGSLRLLGELLELCRWTMNVANRGKDENLPTIPEAPQLPASVTERLARRDRFLKSLDETP